MDDASTKPTAPAELAQPQVRLNGPVDDSMLRQFIDGLQAVEADGSGPLVLELTTTGGDADVGRRIAADLRLFRERTGRPTLFIGKAVVYSAGVTIMSGCPASDRYLARGTMLLIHCRQIQKSLELNGSLKSQRMPVEAILAEIQAGLELEEQDFRRLIEGSSVTLSELLERAEVGWYAEAGEAKARGLIGGVI